MKARARRPLTVALVACATACAGADDATPRREADVGVVVSFEGYVYADAAASTPTILERLRRQQQSAVGTLRRARITVDPSRQAIDMKSLRREPVTVVDPSGEPGRAVRVRYRFRAAAKAPRAAAAASEVPLALAHGDGPARAARIAELCVPPAERDARAEAAPWSSFDGALASCQRALAEEQSGITAARAALSSPAEVTPLERDRLLLPATAKLRARRPNGPKGAALPLPRAAASAAAGAPSDEAPPAPPPAVVDPLAHTAAEPAEADDDLDADFERLGAGSPGSDADAPGGDGQGRPDPPAFRWFQPNYYVLVFVGLALFVLLRRGRNR